MRKPFEQWIKAVRPPPENRQNVARQRLRDTAKNDRRYRLTIEQIEDVKLSIAEADRGEFATERGISETWKRFGL